MLRMAKKSIIKYSAHFERNLEEIEPRQPRSVEATNALARLRAKLLALTTDPEALREYVFKDYLLLYARIGSAMYLLALRHPRQLSFDFEGHWGR